MATHNPAGSLLAAAESPPAGRTAARPWRKVFPLLGAVASILLLWQIAASLLPAYLLPGVPAVAQRLVRDVADPKFLAALQASLLRLAVGFPAAVVLGTLLGLLAGVNRAFAGYLRNVINILQSVPPVTWIPFLIILFGFGNVPVILMITIASFFPMALAVMNAAEGVSKTHLEVARNLGAGRWQLLMKVYLPETMPAIISGAQVSFGNAWRQLIAGEMVGGASVGLGFAIHYAGEIADMKGVLMGIVVIGALAVFLDYVVIETIKRRVLRWRYVGGNAE